MAPKGARMNTDGSWDLSRCENPPAKSPKILDAFKPKQRAGAAAVGTLSVGGIGVAAGAAAGSAAGGQPEAKQGANAPAQAPAQEKPPATTPEEPPATTPVKAAGGSDTSLAEPPAHTMSPAQAPEPVTQAPAKALAPVAQAPAPVEPAPATAPATAPAAKESESSETDTMTPPAPVKPGVVAVATEAQKAEPAAPACAAAVIAVGASEAGSGAKRAASAGDDAAAAGATTSSKKIKLIQLIFDHAPEPLTLKMILTAGEGVDPMQDYAKKLVPYVQSGLKKYLVVPPAGSALAASNRELREYQPLAIQNMKSGDALTTFREAFSYENAKTALGNVGLYEAAGNLFWLDALLQHWNGANLKGNDLVWTQLVAARTLWEEAALTGSCPENESLRRLTFPSFLPSAIGDLSEMKGDASGFCFQDTPLFSGQAIVIAWYEAMDRALRLENADCHNMIKHLFQAALSVPIRYRLSPSTNQVQLDSLNYSEVLRQAGTACVDSFWDFAIKMQALQPLANLIGNSKVAAQEVVNKCATLALRYKGKEIARHTALALDALSPFIKDADCCAKYKRCESVTTSLNDCTKLYKLAQATSKYFQASGPQAAAGAFGTLLDMMRFGLQTNSLQAEQLTQTFLTADRQPKGTPGFIHLTFKKLELASWLESSIRSQCSTVPHVDEIKKCVFPALLTMEAASNLWLLRLSTFGMIPEDEAAVADAENNNWQAATSAGWEEFKKTLSDISASLAELLWMMWAGAYDEELMVLAGQTLSGPMQPWHKYLDIDTKEEAERSPMQAQWNLYMSLVMAKPKALDEQRVQFDVAADDDEMDDSTKETLQKTICELRKKKVTFLAAAGALTGPGAYLKAIGAFYEQSRTGKKWRRGKDEVRLMLLSADLFHKHADKFHRETARGAIQSVSDDFAETIKFLLQKKETSDILIVANGRSRAAESQIVTSDLYGHKDAHTILVVYQSAEPKKDARISKRAAPLKGMNTETLHVVMPVTTSKFLKPRHYFNSCGEATTFEPTFTGVPPPDVAHDPQAGQRGRGADNGARRSRWRGRYRQTACSGGD